MDKLKGKNPTTGGKLCQKRGEKDRETLIIYEEDSLEGGAFLESKLLFTTLPPLYIFPRSVTTCCLLHG